MDDQGMGFHPRGMTLVSDVSAARWIERSLQASDFGRVGSLILEGFARYVRLLHPAHDSRGRRITWGEVAAWSGQPVHSEMAFERIAVPREGFGGGSHPWSEQPLRGSLEESDAAALAGFLTSFTGTPGRCFFAVWEGYGHLWPGGMAVLSRSGRKPQSPPGEVRGVERLAGVARKYILYAGPLSAVTSFFAGLWNASPNLWWPEDRTWCVATDIDLDSTYLGGSEACIEALRHDTRFEVLPTSRDAPVYPE